jgi:hypothetical protein
MREQKKKHQVQSSTAPKPPSKPPKQALSQPDNNNKASSRDTRAVNQSSHPARQYSNDTSRLLMDKATCRHPQNQEENKNDSESSPHRQQSEDEQEQQANNYIRYNRNQRPRQEQQQSEVHAPSPQQQLVDQHAYNNNSIRKSQYGDNERMNQIRNKVSDNMGSTATRGQIKRKPLNKSLMEQVTNEMAMARQRDAEHQQAVENSVKKSNRSHRKTNSNGSLDSLLKTFEGGEAPKAAPSHPIAAVSEEAKSRRQPSEYKPDTGSIPVRRGIENNAAMNRVLQEINPIEPSAQQKQQDPLLTHQVAPPKSPRPPPQQIVGEVQPVEGTDPYQHLQHYSTSPSITPSSTPPEHNSYINQQYLTNQNYPNQHMGPPPNAPQHQQYMMQPQRSPMMQPQVSPMMQPQRSPMMQPQRSPMMQPQVSPLMQPQRSPMMTPMLHSPMIQPQQQQQLQQRGATLPPPITIPASNYMASSPQPSPAISYSNLGPVSPGGILPPPQYPAIPQQQALPRPALYSDGRPIQFWGKI